MVVVLWAVLAVAAPMQVQTEQLVETVSALSEQGSVLVLAERGPSVRRIRALASNGTAAFSVRAVPQRVSQATLDMRHLRSGQRCSLHVTAVTTDLWSVSPVGECSEQDIVRHWEDDPAALDRPVGRARDHLRGLALAQTPLVDETRILYGVRLEPLASSMSQLIERNGYTLSAGADDMFGVPAGRTGVFIGGEVESVEEADGWPLQTELSVNWRVFDADELRETLRITTRGYAAHDGSATDAQLREELVLRALHAALEREELAAVVELAPAESTTAAPAPSRLRQQPVHVDTALRARLDRSARVASRRGAAEVIAGVCLGVTGIALASTSYADATKDRPYMSRSRWTTIQATNTLGWALMATSPVLVWDGTRRARHPRGVQ